jgi:hypothetical protein
MQTLTILDLGYNDISEQGVQYLNGALQQNRVREEIVYISYFLFNIDT